MWRKLANLAVVVALSGVLVVFGAQATLAAAGGTGPDDAAAFPAGGQTAAPGSMVWYQFQYAGDGSQVLIDMPVTSGSAGFAVVTPDGANVWRQGNGLSWVGVGSPDDAMNGDMVWSGSFNTPGTYYVVVTNSGDAPSDYSMKITGSGVSFPTAATATGGALPGTTAASPAAGAPAAAPAAAAPAAAAAKGPKGNGPDDAMALPQGAVTIPAGATIWYSFQYPGDGSQVIFDMAVSDGSASYYVLTPDNANAWRQGNGLNWVGIGSPDDAMNGDMVWSGNFDFPGTFFVVVQNTSAAPATFTLTIS